MWVELPESIDTDQIYHEALKRDILIAPGSLFSMRGKYTNCLRLNAGFWNDRVEDAICYLGKCCHNFAESRN